MTFFSETQCSSSSSINICLRFVLQTWMNARKTMAVVITSATTQRAVIAVTAMLAIGSTNATSAPATDRATMKLKSTLSN